VDCTALEIAGEMTWSAQNGAWVYMDSDGRLFSLTCGIVGPDPQHPGHSHRVWVLGASGDDCACQWMSFENPGAEPSCGVTCAGGTFDEDCFESGSYKCMSGQVTIWPI
jgi:hypothetical protein